MLAEPESLYLIPSDYRCEPFLVCVLSPDKGLMCAGQILFQLSPYPHLSSLSFFFFFFLKNWTAVGTVVGSWPATVAGPGPQSLELVNPGLAILLLEDGSILLLFFVGTTQ